MNENAVKNGKETLASKGIDFESKVKKLGNQYIGFLQNAMDEAELDTEHFETVFYVVAIVALVVVIGIELHTIAII